MRHPPTKTSGHDTQLIVSGRPLDFIARLAALVPKPRVHLTRFDGVFAPNSSYRARVVSFPGEAWQGWA
jgi:hypothetical protein